MCLPFLVNRLKLSLVIFNIKCLFHPSEGSISVVSHDSRFSDGDCIFGWCFWWLDGRVGWF